MTTQYVAHNSTADQSITQAIEVAHDSGSATNINWTDPSVALWMRAVANGNPTGVPGCPSREVFDVAYAAYLQD